MINYHKERYEYLKSRGRCTYCGVEQAMYNHTLCPECACKRDEIVKRSRAKDKNYKKKDVIYHQKLAERREEVGLCRRCGKRKPLPGKKQCIECKVKRRKDYLKSLNSKMDKRETKEYFNLCRICGAEELVKGKKLCPTCYKKILNNLEKAKAKLDPKDHYWRKEEELHFAMNKGRV